MEKKSDVYCAILKELVSFQESIQESITNNVNNLISIYHKVLQLSDEGVLTTLEYEFLINNVCNQLDDIRFIMEHIKR